jgi:hypothetical protein
VARPLLTASFDIAFKICRLRQRDASDAASYEAKVTTEDLAPATADLTGPTVLHCDNDFTLIDVVGYRKHGQRSNAGGDDSDSDAVG